jgi:hypothetical protein
MSPRRDRCAAVFRIVTTLDRVPAIEANLNVGTAQPTAQTPDATHGGLPRGSSFS